MTDIPPSRHAAKRRILRNTSANAVAQAAAMLSTLIFLPLLVRAFGLSVYGVMVLAASVSSYAILLDLGVGATLTRMVAERTALDDRDGAARAVFSAATIYGAVGSTVAIVMFALGLFAGVVFRLTGIEADLLRLLLWIGAATQLWYWPTAAARDALAGLQRYDIVSGVTLGVVLADIIGTIFVLATGHGPVVLLAIKAAEAVGASLVNIWMLSRLMPGLSRRISASVADIRAILRSGSSVFVLQIAQIMSRQQTDKIVLAVFLGPAYIAIYDIAAKLNSLISTFMGLTTSAVLPVVAELNAREEHYALRSLFLRGTKIAATAVAPIVTVLIVVAGPFIGAWCRNIPNSTLAVPVAQVLLLSQVLLPLYQLGDQVLIGKNRFHLWVRGGLTMAFVNVIVSVVLTRAFGLIGVAIGTLSAVLLEFPWYAAVFSREMELPIPEWLRKTAWPAYPLLVVPALIAWFGVKTVLGASLPGIIALGVVAAVAYWLVAFFAAYSPLERADLLSTLRRAPSERVA